MTLMIMIASCSDLDNGERSDAMKLIFNDSEEIIIQSASVTESYLQIKIIVMARENILALSKDTEKTRRMVVKDIQDSTTYERYRYRSLTEYDGGIYEVTMIQEGQSPEERLDAVESATAEVYATVDSILTDILPALTAEQKGKKG